MTVPKKIKAITASTFSQPAILRIAKVIDEFGPTIVYAREIERVGRESFSPVSVTTPSTGPATTPYQPVRGMEEVAVVSRTKPTAHVTGPPQPTTSPGRPRRAAP